ncbi:MULTISPECIES: amidohydrolase family protein [Paenarthrobacter]|uniref:amidohydrolase family protein n=1 Tax=Paenarthrobacter TaxID=1742992 RepID=UPI00074D361D|nr:amidohydrolase family protein [Paenarthrobacter ureafaciens]AMB39145.1 amidohydrolase [Arthrobacter sp. ATCC 21022]KUR66329.1 amidohydrolase [Arthrobacter sp. ATCC 21022]RWW95365.1 amidohydrolase [Paenarthrobacter ureafaciens]
MSTNSIDNLQAAIEEIPLVDHHVHGALKDEVDRTSLEELLTESDRPIPPWMTQFDSQLGFAIRRWCAPLLGLSRHAEADAFFQRRMELGTTEVTSRLLTSAGIGHFLIETGYRGDQIHGLSGMESLSKAKVSEVVRLESVAESLAAEGVSADDFADRYIARLSVATENAVGVKSIIAYRLGFDFDPVRPSREEVAKAAGSWLRMVTAGYSLRISDPVLLRFLLWSGVDRGLPIQLHTGYGDPDLSLDRCDPLLLVPWIKLIEPFGVDVVLLHCYPYQRHAGYLAQVFPHIYFDVGLGINYTGVQSMALIKESLELAPFSKILFSTDAWGPPELHYLGARLWREGMRKVLGTWVRDGDWSEQDAIRVVRMVGRENAQRVYNLGGV